ncbi:protein-tyrosine-phosphatase [Pseudoclavibacter sp. RFBJ3]|uniref:tyrosine-protein phosphatase n=1 Tax=unclassified Pseudoclavibacter TaxID=2615177 RepID=UPI000CE7A348|nr:MULTISPECIES: tyrosine-protein phosphatase [unclassified Pseudoclavibacter]MBF4552075.1 tyrosine-protein phosphatase [Pseudoclavibacter sp. VKM Ac-2888]PPF80901.1 protein-tyrosine-phosphatase [Pseudoclavibacter sp. RFBJ5]PPF94410.1 protein-tyrosine-phosphatase [Pseudoclavibacter sp. RFBJ3]PPF99517.1 protein-tyrosine-phosphatase [Pseudoclavibacter sp. RFBH5]PPG25712.1 protein-tyrosine-phosphatase [Pseudoclavibacter sp. RFBI4]
MTTTLDITLSAPVNLRDLGGTPIAGGPLREGLAIRADDLSVITEADARELTAGGLASVIDLRTADEVALTGRGPLSAHPVAYHHLPLMGSVGGGLPTADEHGSAHAGMGEMYALMVESAAPQLAAALGIIAVSPGATAFHCAAGRDRTGVLAAMLLLALGAADDDIVRDYAKTDANMGAILARIGPTMSVLLAKFGMDLEEVSKLNGSLTGDAEPMDVSMRILLARLRERHGDPLAPLRAAGLTDATIAQLRERAAA